MQPTTVRHADNIFQSAQQNASVQAIDLSTLGKRVAFIREQREMNQSELARATRFSQPSISDLENDRTKEVSAKLLAAVARALTVPWEFLLDGNTRPDQVAAEAAAEAELVGIYRALSSAAKVSLIEFGRHLRASKPSLAVTTGSPQPQTGAQDAAIKRTPVKKNRTASIGLFDVGTGKTDAVGKSGGVSKQRRRKNP